MNATRETTYLCSCNARLKLVVLEGDLKTDVSYKQLLDGSQEYCNFFPRNA